MQPLPDLRAVYAERRTRLLATVAELPDELRPAIEELIAEADRRLAGDTTALADKADVRRRLNRMLAAVLEDVLTAFGMRGHASPGSAQWQDRKSDIIRALLDAKKPTRSARRLVAAAVTYGDALTVEVLTSPHSRVLLHGLMVDWRAVQVQAVRALSEQEGAPTIPGVRFILAQESEISLVELCVYAQFLTPKY